jgi:hypothetical protein
MRMNVLALSYPGWVIMSVFIEFCLLSKIFLLTYKLHIYNKSIIWTTFREFVLLPPSGDSLSFQWLILKSVRIMTISTLKMLSQTTSETICLWNVPKVMDCVRNAIAIISLLHWHIFTRMQERPFLFIVVAWSIDSYVTGVCMYVCMYVYMYVCVCMYVCTENHLVIFNMLDYHFYDVCSKDLHWI